MKVAKAPLAAVDAVLARLSGDLVKVRDGHEKRAVVRKIDAALDERLKLMPKSVAKQVGA